MSGIVGIVNLDGASIDREQGAWTGRDDIWITGDARIDGRTNTELTDLEEILRAYEAWGEGCVEHLIGDFAFAIWDGRVRRLFCARDHFGVKPFYYASFASTFVFSNTLNVLRLHPQVSDELNETAVGDYLAFGVNQDLATTTFRDIQRLPPAHSLSLVNGCLTIRRYWKPSTGQQIRFRNAQSYVDQFRELLTAATNDRLRTSRVAISMSGGLDSTSIAVTARDLSVSSVFSFATVYDSLIPDEERHYSTLAAKAIGIPIHHLSADAYTLFEGQLDQPEPFLISPLSGQFNDLLRLMAGSAQVALTGYDGDAFMNEPRRSFLSAFRTRIKRIKGSDDQSSYPDWIDESFARRINLSDRWKQFLSSAPDVANKTRPATIRALESKIWAPLFEGYDPGSTRVQLEVRHPFIDIRLVNYLLAIPTTPWCVNKHILRCAMCGRLPDAVLNRPKTPLAGDPALQLSRRGGVRWLDNFTVTPQLTRFVNLKLRRSLAEEKTPDALWANLRLFALNHWLAHSLPLDRRMVA